MAVVTSISDRPNVTLVHVWKSFKEPLNKSEAEDDLVMIKNHAAFEM